MTTPRLWILASASPRRRELLSLIGLKFVVRPSHVSEPPRRGGERAGPYTERVARLKAAEIAAGRDRGVVIAADTIVISGGRFLGKPASPEEAARMLRGLSGRWHEVVTGLCLVDCATGRTGTAHSRSRVHFRRLTAAEIGWYLESGEYRDKAGAYAIQGYGSLFIDRIEGCYFNVVGFPLSTFERLAHSMGLDLIRARAGN